MLRPKAELEKCLREKKCPDSVEEGFGFWSEVLTDFFSVNELVALGLPVQKQDGTVFADDEPAAFPYTEEAVLAEMAKYMAFAWGKVEGHRGISASRSVEKIGVMVWLLTREDVLKEMAAASYSQYGAPKLAVACRAFGLTIPDDAGLARMIEGDPCRPGCSEGCGS